MSLHKRSPRGKDKIYKHHEMKFFLTLLLILPIIAFGQVSDATGLSGANQIKNETVPNANTPTRVGTNFVNLWNSKANKQEANTWSADQTFSTKIGIGASPTYDLDIQKSSGTDVSSRIKNTSTGTVQLLLERTGGTTAGWNARIAAGTTNLTLYDGADKFTFTTAGKFTSTSLAISGGDIVSGTYTPTITAISNIDATTAYSLQYSRIGTGVIISGQIDADATAAGGTTTRVRLSLPIASNFANPNEAGGAGKMVGITSTEMGCYADATNDEVIIHWQSVNATNQSITFMFSYRIL